MNQQTPDQIGARLSAALRSAQPQTRVQAALAQARRQAQQPAVAAHGAVLSWAGRHPLAGAALVLGLVLAAVWWQQQTPLRPASNLELTQQLVDEVLYDSLDDV
ncbi:hypothetical protein [Chitinibacter tainanensis]|uniref:hypothetical protein n=1 Tax=Chitinibacter tainanensis TaxID=230667 RepID=UPI0023525BEE|nr:hypothetical protein [Chitinibacter tainanensis]